MAVALAAALGFTILGAAGSDAHSSSGPNGKLIETVSFDAGKLTVTHGKVELKAGEHYTLVVSGTFTSKDNTSPGPPTYYDALYCYEFQGNGRNQCSPPFAGDEIAIGVGNSSFGSASQVPDIDEFQSAGGPHYPANGSEIPYEASHTYTVDFYPPVSGTFKAAGYNAVYGCGAQHAHCYNTTTGTVTIKIYAPAPSGGGTVRITSLSGEVAVRTAGGPWQSVTAGQTLQAGQELFTGVDSHAVVTFENGSTMQINELTQILGATLQQKENRQNIEVQLVVGAIKATVVHETALDTSFRLRTATATASVRGSTMSVFYDPSSRTEIVATLSDKAYWQRGTKTGTIPQGKEIAITRAGVSRLAPIGKADARGGVDPAKARNLALALIDRHATACRIRSRPGTEATVQPSRTSAWSVSVPVRGKVTGTATWRVARGNVTPLNATARKIAGGC